MSWKPDKNMRTIAVTAFLVVAASMLFYFFLFRTTTLGFGLSKVFSVLNPIIYGFVIAYILNPQMIVYEKIVCRILLRLHKHPGRRGKRAIRIFTTFFALFVMLFILYLLISSIIPELIHSIRNIVLNYQTYADNVNRFINDTFHNPELDEQTAAFLGNAISSVEDWFSSEMVPQINSLATYLTSSVVDFMTFMKNILLGIIISLYILIAKEGMLARFRRFVYAILPVEKANRLLHTLRFADEKFGGFLIGKIIDSLIIGLICYLACLIMRMPYAILIAVVIGVTNIIPFFGPFIGAIPCTVLIFVVSPIKSLIFIIFILCLQQFDGNFLGPKILGTSVGVSSYMVILSILIGGGFFGVPGMVVGVPLCAVIMALAQTGILRRTKKKNLPGDLESYHYVQQINPISGRFEEESDAEFGNGLYVRIRRRSEDLKQFEMPIEGRTWDRTYEQIEEEDRVIRGTSSGEPAESAYFEEENAAGSGDTDKQNFED